MTQLKTLQLKKGQEKRLRVGHLWIYSNEVDTRQTPLKAFEPGECVTVLDARKTPLGSAYINPHSLICARLYSRRAEQSLTGELLHQRLTGALGMRQQIFKQPFYRLVYGESDGLPGLVVDRFGDTLALQCNTAGMDCRVELIADTLQELVSPQHILLMNSSGQRQLEGLESHTKAWREPAPEFIELEENSTLFRIPALRGQKTGWFYDHRSNRQRVQHYAPGKTVLDVFSYAGGWGLQAAKAGAEKVTLIDSSALARELALENARLNGLENQVEAITDDAFEALEKLISSGQHYDLVIVDPPAFIKRKKDLDKGLAAYKRLNKLAMQLIKDKGILLSASCSYHLNRQAHLRTLLDASRQARCEIRILEQGHQGPDHPVHPAIGETDYISAYLVYVSK